MALLTAVFVITLATILVIQFGAALRFDRRVGRSFAEDIQAHYLLKSSVELGRVLLEAPKLEGIQEDWLGEPWALIAAAPSLPISGINGDLRMMIVDESGKIDVNAIYTPGSESSPSEANDFWKNALASLFVRSGFTREAFEENSFRTLGDVGFDAYQQVAAINDWIDPDTISFSSASFEGNGVESGLNHSWFYNRPFSHLSELLLVPGMTAERLSRIAPYVRVGSPNSGTQQINFNTAPLEVLLAIGFPEKQAAELVQERLNLPLTSAILSNLVAGDPQLQRVATVTSNDFSVFAKLRLANGNYWIKAKVRAVGPPIGRRTQLTEVEYY